MDADLGDFLQKLKKTDHLFIDHLAIYNVKRVPSTNMHVHSLNGFASLNPSYF